MFLHRRCRCTNGYIMGCRKPFRIFLGVQMRVTPCKYMNFLNMFQIKFQHVYRANALTLIAFGVFESVLCCLFLLLVVFAFNGDDGIFVVWWQ